MRIYVRARYLVLTVLASLVGVFTGIMSFILSLLIELNTKFFLSGMDNYKPPLSMGEVEILRTGFHFGEVPIFLIPALGGLLCGITGYFLSPETLGGGTSEAIEAFHFLGKISKRVPFIKIVVTGFTIGSGGSGGREGPIMQIGAGMGSLIGNFFRISEKDRRMLLACGMGAGMGSIFLSPIGGAIFGIEVLYRRDYEVEAFVPAVVSSITAYAVFHSILGYFTGIPFGSLRIFEAPDMRIRSPLELLSFLILGIVGGAVSLLYIECYKKIKIMFRKIPVHTALKPAIGGLIVGIIGWRFNYILGTGYGYAQMAINGAIPADLLWMITFAKILSTTISIGSGGSGGLFAPAVVIGGMLGGGMGSFLHNVFPGIAGNPPSYILVGMATLIAGAFKTPLAAVIMVFEMTGSYNLLPALAAASIASYAVSGNRTICEIQPASRVESPIHRGELSVDVLESIRVSEAMTPADEVFVVSPNATILDVLALIEKTGHIGFPVVEDGRLVGMITFEDVERVPIDERARKKISAVMSKNLIVTYPDETLEDALLKLANYDIGRLPVVSREDKSRLLGLITRSAIIRAHAKATR